MKTNGPTCPEVAEQLNAYLDDALPSPQRQGMEAHMASCARCRSVLAELRCTRRLLRGLPRDPMPAALKRHLLDHLRNHQTPES